MKNFLKKLSYNQSVNIVYRFFRNNYFHLLICLIVVFLIVVKELSKNAPPIINLPADSINYYWDILNSLGISYIAGFIFYLLVVYIPEQRKRRNIEVSLSTHFGTICNNACRYLNETFIAFNFEFEETSNIEQSFTQFNSDKDPYEVLSSSIAKSEYFHYYEEPYKNRYEHILEASSKILEHKNKLVPYIAFMNKQELNCYSVLEDIRIFEQIHKLPTIGYYFWNTLDEVLELIRYSEKTLRWSRKYKAEYKDMKRELLAQ